MVGSTLTGFDRILLADIGGTNARFALLNQGEIGPISRIKVAEQRGFIEAVTAFLTPHMAGGAIGAAVLGVAGTVEENRCRVTNSGWMVDGGVLQAAFGFKPVRLLNDFEALAWSLPRLKPTDLYPNGGGRSVAGAPMLVIGPGTGFGAACLVSPDGSAVAIAAEAGHATLPGTSQRDDAVIDHLRSQFGHVSAERALSGPGLENLYTALAAIDRVDVPHRDATAITQAALDGSCGVCRAALDMFCAMLGTVAGNLALTFCARGGVFIAGGIVPRFVDDVARSKFRERFEAKGRFRSYLEGIPTNIILRPDATFVGLQAFFERQGPVPGKSDRRG
jgi:glucokinase